MPIHANVWHCIRSDGTPGHPDDAHNVRKIKGLHGCAYSGTCAANLKHISGVSRALSDQRRRKRPACIDLRVRHIVVSAQDVVSLANASRKNEASARALPLAAHISLWIALD